MSRNIGRETCAFCHSEIELLERPRLITPADAGDYYFKEHEGMTVTKAQCPVCLAQYLAWTERHDLSFRSTFNNEPGKGAP